jgi:trimethylguanosine synthase
MGRKPFIGGLSRFVDALNDKEKDGQPPQKKRKIDDSTPDGWVDAYDATGLVPFYDSAEQVPDRLLKCSSIYSDFEVLLIPNTSTIPDFSQRTRFFSKYHSPPGCLLDEQGWYSVTPELIADQIAERCRSDTVLDPFCGVGGNAIAFAKTCSRVIALDIDPTRLALARHNAMVYGVENRIEFVLADYVTFAESYLARDRKRGRKIDVIFLSPPWGGPEYLSSPQKKPSDTTGAQDTDADSAYSLSSIKPIPGDQLFHLSRKITKNIAYYLPRNTNLDEVSQLLRHSDSSQTDTTNSSLNGKTKGKSKASKEYIEVEEEWMGNKLKALTCYFGGLVGGQEHMFDEEPSVSPSA